MTWVSACKFEDIEQEGAVRFVCMVAAHAIYRGPDDGIYCTAGLCTHEAIHLADGLVMDFGWNVPNIPAPSTTAPARRCAFRLREPENLPGRSGRWRYAWPSARAWRRNVKGSSCRGNRRGQEHGR